LKDLLYVEVKAMACLNHENIVNQLQYGTDMYIKSSGKQKEVSYIVLELAAGGELFDFISASGRFEEPLARYFFK
jgi:serine/threonine protein kinase